MTRSIIVRNSTDARQFVKYILPNWGPRDRKRYEEICNDWMHRIIISISGYFQTNFILRSIEIYSNCLVIDMRIGGTLKGKEP